MKTGKLIFLSLLVFSFLFLIGICSQASAANRVLELRNNTSRKIWIARSEVKMNEAALTWTALTPGNWGIWHVNEGGYLYYSYDKINDPGRREHVFETQLPFHKDYRWFWMLVPNGTGLTLTADYERARGRDASK